MDHCIDLDAPHLAPCFRVPFPLRNSVEPMFNPHVVSIGPLHHPSFNRRPHAGSSNNLSLAEMESYKLLAVRAMSDNLIFDELIKFLESKEKEMLSFYDGNLLQDYHDDPQDAGSALAKLVALDALAKLVALDACFIVCFLHSLFEDSLPCLQEKLRIDEDASVIPKASYSTGFLQIYRKKLSRPVRKAILRDFLLVENQIPLFAVKQAIRADKRCLSETEAERRLDMYLAAMAVRVLPFNKSTSYVLDTVRKVSKSGKHLLDCMYSVVCAESISHDYNNCKHESLEHNPEGVPGATELYLSGVTLHGHVDSLMQVSFNKGKLSIPKIHVGDDTEKIFRNLLAYESSYKVERVDILSYVHFMDCLVDTPQDVELLIKHKVITESIGSSEKVAEMWNKLCRNTACVISPKYTEVSKHAKAYYNNPLQGMWAEFYRSNLSRPWLVVPVISAAVLLIMTFVIMWFTLLLYWHDPTTQKE